MNMRERLANALCKKAGGEPGGLMHDYHLECADAVLDEMRMPDEAMIGAAVLNGQWSVEREYVISDWQAMIDATKEDK